MTSLLSPVARMAARLARGVAGRDVPSAERRSFRDIAAALAAAGHGNPATGKAYSAETIRLALAGDREAA
jgi:hypothetical protein